MVPLGIGLLRLLTVRSLRAYVVTMVITMVI
jgi:hypothetical protein